MAHLVGGRAAQIERCGGRSDGSRVLVSIDHAIRRGVSTGELGVSEDAASDVADPEVEVVGVGPGVRSALAGELHGIVGAEAIDRGGHAKDARGGVALRVKTGEAEFDLRIGCLRPGVISVAVQPAEIGVEHVQLRLDLGVGDVLRLRAIDDVEDHGDGHHRVLVVGALLGHDRSPFLRVLLDALHGIGVFLKSHHLHVLFVGMAGPLGKKGRGGVLGRKRGILRNGGEGEQRSAAEQKELLHDLVNDQ